jgi:hypothetical protein
MRLAGHVRLMSEKRNSYRMGDGEARRQIETLMMVNIKVDFREIRWVNMDWTDQA